MGVKMNLRIITKNHAADPKKREKIFVKIFIIEDLPNCVGKADVDCNEFDE